MLSNTKVILVRTFFALYTVRINQNTMVSMEYVTDRNDIGFLYVILFVHITTLVYIGRVIFENNALITRGKRIYNLFLSPLSATNY